MLKIYSYFQVYDQYVNFITLEEDMFILRHQNSDDISYYSKFMVILHQKFVILLFAVCFRFE